MLRNLKIKNFLSWEEADITFLPDSTIAIVGDNGHGKSGLFEAIRFALYGDGRDDLKSLIRLGSEDEGMSVKLTMIDVPQKGKKVEVERGVKPSGDGYTHLYMNGKLLEKGGAKPSNNKAQTMIESILGENVDEFSLTSFFGLGVNDVLMQVKPSERLETLQSLAGVDICVDFHKKANEYVKAIEQVISLNRREMEVKEESVSDIEVLKEAAEKADADVISAKSKLDKLLVKKSELKDEGEKYNSFLREKEGLRSKRSLLMKQKEKAEQQYLGNKEIYTRSKERLNDAVTKRSKNEKDFKSYDEIDLVKKKNEAIENRASINSEIQLRQIAIETDKDTCPLCGSKIIKKYIIDLWKNEIDFLKKKHDKINAEYEDIEKSLHKIEQIRTALNQCNRTIETESSTVERCEGVMKDLEVQKITVSSDLEKIESRLVLINKEMKGYDELQDKISAIEIKIGEVQKSIGGLRKAAESAKYGIEESKEKKNQIEELRKVIDKDEKKVTAYKRVAEAFSRYAIPISLLTKLRGAIESRSSRIYQAFGSGTIRIRDIGGARPGVEFILADESGERSYRMLSSGEKVMVYLAVRVAITQIINSGKNNKVDFLILDEVTGPLSPKKRESLTKLINSILKKFFPQIFMVSHVELRDIFKQTLKVEKVNGISKVV